MKKKPDLVYNSFGILKCWATDLQHQDISNK